MITMEDKGPNEKKEEENSTPLIVEYIYLVIADTPMMITHSSKILFKSFFIPVPLQIIYFLSIYHTIVKTDTFFV